VVTHIALIWLPAKALVIEINGGPDQRWLWRTGCQAPGGMEIVALTGGR
jgi:hypothetical protein